MNKGFNLFSVIGIISVTSIISAITVGVIITNEYRGNNGTSYGELIKDENIQEFLNIYESVLSDYYEDVDKEKMIDGAINGMLNYLGDNYTTYLTPEEKKALAERLEGSYEGVGITISGCEIVEISSNSPAEKAGLMEGDVITKVDDLDLTVCDNESLSNAIKNSGKDKVHISVRRGNEFLGYDVPLSKIIIPAVSSKMLDNTNIGYIAIEIFSNNIGLQFKTAFEALKNQGMEKLIIDVRNNTGGYLDGAKDIASIFVAKDKLLFSLKNKDQKSDFYDTTDETQTLPVVILINGNSASSSEILSAALKDSYGATLIGTKSYGKGKVQQTYTLEDGSMAKYTTAYWLRPNGECIDGIGLAPDIEVIEPSLEENPENIDFTLNKAIEQLQ